ncbi:MAG: hypothetical protein WA632_04325 [Gallionella sp.]
MDFQNSAYAVAQLFHNFGAVAVVGGSAAGLALQDAKAQRRIARIVVVGWLIQIISGASFGAISYYYYSAFPELSFIAEIALVVKVCCATTGLLLGAWLFDASRIERFRPYNWIISCGLGTVALSSAAVLRWFS